MRFELQKIGRRWGKRIALVDVSLTVESGENVAFIGPSGSGKTTLLKILGGALTPSAGRVLVDGRCLEDLSYTQIQAHRAAMGVMAQGGNLVPQLSVHRNVTAGLLSQWPWYKILASTLFSLEKESTQRVLESVGLGDRQWDRTATLSGGQQQRVAIARALAGTPQVILADEPTAGLDPCTGDEIAELLISRTRSEQLTLLLCTHWVSMARRGVDRLVGIRDGAVFFDKPTAEVAEPLLEALYNGSRERR
jgi:phosphonate transport system ATP-binding protein